MSLDKQNLIDNCIQKITDICNKYENNPYMLQRINNHIINYLPNTLDNELKNFEKRVSRNNFLISEKEMFIQIFLSKNQYYYLSNSNYFYEYDGKNYNIVKEDDIIHNLLSNISKDRVLLQWKHRTKTNIIKQIKERSLFNSVPESNTIQNIINILYPSIFTSKNQVKYFLTVIGDNILKKNTNLIFLVTSKTKKLLNEIDNIAYLSINNSVSINNFMTKYHENHSYNNCRLIKMNENFSLDLWKNMIKTIGLNLICVACHYSNRYGNSDYFIENKADDDELKSYVFYIKNNNQKEIVDKFCTQYIETIEDESNSDTDNNSNKFKLEWKNVHFIWKQFIYNFPLPNMIYSNTLKGLLKEKYEYDEQTDSFYNITSKYLPNVSDFILFWEKTINIIPNIEGDYYFENDIEVDELCKLFKLWVRQNSNITNSNGNINEDNIIKIISHFFPNIEIIEDKFILNITCGLWNKQNDINSSLVFIKNYFNNTNNNNLLSFDDAYDCYCKFISTGTYKFVVSKRYFEKYLYMKLHDFIVYDKFINHSWFIE
jgi:hypothetical protein